MHVSQYFKPWWTRTHCCGHIVAHDVSWAAQTGKHLLRTQNVSKQNQKHFLCPGHKICVRNKCCVRVQTKKQLCRQQCVRNNVSSFARAFRDKLFVAPEEVVIICISEKTRCQVSIIGELIFGTRFNRNRYNIAKFTFFNFCSLKAKAGTTTECDWASLHSVRFWEFLLSLVCVFNGFV